jgi:AcrR family transcriptional regulator
LVSTVATLSLAEDAAVGYGCYKLAPFVSDGGRTGHPLGPELLESALAGSEERLDVTRERILDAALEQFEDVGIRRSSVEAVAQRAGVSRITVYRRFPRKDALVSALAVREASRLIAAADAHTTQIPDAEERAVEGFVVLLQMLRAHELTTRLVALEPESALSSLTVEAGPVLALGTAYVAEQIRRGQREGDFAFYEPEPVAELLVRFAHSVLLTPRAVVDLDDEAALRRFAREYVAPILRGGGSASRPAGGDRL